GDSATCTMVAGVGYHLTALSDYDGTTTNDVFGSITGSTYLQSAYTASNVVKSRTVTAGFSINTYQVTVPVAPVNGTLVCTAGEIGHGVPASCTVTPLAGYHLVSLTDNAVDVTGGVTAGTYSIESVTAAHIMAATFAINTYAVNGSKIGSGTIVCSPNPVNHNVDSVCTVTPAAGYELTALTDNAVDVYGGGALLNGGNYTITAVQAAHSVIATFTIKQYNVTISSAANGSFSPVSPLVIDHGRFVTITLSPVASHEVDPAAVDIGVNACPGTLRGNQFELGPVTADCTLTTGYKIRTFTVAASQNGVGGEITAPLSRTIDYGTTTAFELVPASGYLSTAEGCGGTLAGDTFTTGAVAGDCNINVVFRDITAPTVDVFALPTANSSLSVPIALLTTSDNSTAAGGTGVTGWYIVSTDKSTDAVPVAAPVLTEPVAWLDVEPTKFILPANTGAGTKTLYIWVRDAAGNVSAIKSADVKIVFPAQTRLIRTGQETCFDVAGDVVDCSVTVDTHDGKIKAGVPWIAASRFIDNWDGSFTDTATGLMWTQSANVKYARTYGAEDGLIAWQDALDYVKIMNSGPYQGYNDWRLPNRSELTSIVNYGSPSLAAWFSSFTPAFTDIPADPVYWTSTTASTPSSAYTLNNDGTISAVDKTTMAYMLVVRTPQATDVVGYYKPRANLLVTGQSSCFNADGTDRLCADSNTAEHTGEDGDMMSGVPYVAPRFVNPDGTALDADSTIVFDQASGLSWARNASTPLCTVPATSVPLSGVQSWDNALAYINCLNSTFFGGTANWRLPNVLEYTTLINSSQSANATWLNEAGFTTVQGADYWTSDTVLATPVDAYSVNMGAFSVSTAAKSAQKFVWPVRGGYIYSPGIPFSLSAGAINFGLVAGGTTSVPVIFTLTNDSGAALTISSAAVSGADASMFTLHTDGGGSTACGPAPFVLAADDSCSMGMTFTASSTMGPRAASLAITGSTGYTSNLPLSAEGGPNTYRVTILPSDGGTVSCIQESVVEGSGQAINCFNTPNEGKAFIKFIDQPLTDPASAAVESTESLFTINPVTSNHQLYATFGVKTYTLGTATTGSGSGSFPAIAAVQHGSAAPVFALIPAAGS
ncbi:MAG: DUF1566 domain-containing protein, partial [Desulfuromonadaceae bacterium]|nr:DUF1566 domain-containing protein [Desulfuromonadaceae bacterium]